VFVRGNLQNSLERVLGNSHISQFDLFGRPNGNLGFLARCGERETRTPSPVGELFDSLVNALLGVENTGIGHRLDFFTKDWTVDIAPNFSVLGCSLSRFAPR
jgi:hypothetical protein